MTLFVEEGEEEEKEYDAMAEQRRKQWWWGWGRARREVTTPGGGARGFGGAEPHGGRDWQLLRWLDKTGGGGPRACAAADHGWMHVPCSPQKRSGTGTVGAPRGSS